MLWLLLRYLEVLLEVMTYGILLVTAMRAGASVASHHRSNMQTRRPMSPVLSAPFGRLTRQLGEDCPICSSTDEEEALPAVQTNCGHWYCARCILEYCEGLGGGTMKCRRCLEEITMLHLEAARDTANDSSGQDTTEPAPPAPGLTRSEERVARYNERNSGRRRRLSQVVKDAPWLWKRYNSDIARGDKRILAEMMRRGVHIHIITAAVYLMHTLQGSDASTDGVMAGLVYSVYFTVLYRTILLSLDKARVTSAAAADTRSFASNPVHPIAGSNAASDTSLTPVGKERLADAASSTISTAVLAVLVVMLGNSLGGGLKVVAFVTVIIWAAAAVNVYRIRRLLPPLT